MISSGAGGWYSYYREGFESRLPNIFKENYFSNKQFNIALNNWRDKKCYLEPDQDFRAFSTCAPQGNLNSKKSILIWGDSHAAHLVPGYLKRYGGDYKIIQRTGSACPPILNIEKSNRPHCKENNQKVLELIKNEHPSLIVLSGNWYHYKWRDIQEVVQQIRRQGMTKIQLIGPFPFWLKGLPQQLFLTIKSGNRLSIPKRIKEGLREDLFKLNKSMGLFAQEIQVNYISPVDILCNEDGCLVTSGEGSELPIVFDNSHLTQGGAEFLVEKFPK